MPEIEELKTSEKEQEFFDIDNVPQIRQLLITKRREELLRDIENCRLPYSTVEAWHNAQQEFISKLTTFSKQQAEFEQEKAFYEQENVLQEQGKEWLEEEKAVFDKKAAELELREQKVILFEKKLEEVLIDKDQELLRASLGMVGFYDELKETKAAKKEVEQNAK